MAALKTKSRKTTRSKNAGKDVKFLQKPTCTTCRKARSFMQKRGFQLYFRDLAKDKLSADEIEKLIGKRDYTDFLNTRNELFRRKKMKEKPPTRREAVRLMAQEPNLIRRPVIVAGGRVVVGFDPDGIARL